MIDAEDVLADETRRRGVAVHLAVPGLDVKVHFKPQAVGQYEIACAELCGQQHYKMRAYMLVLPADEYDSLVAMPQAQFNRRVSELVKKYPLNY